MTSIETRVAGIPCQVFVTHFAHQVPHRGSPHTCESDFDFYGFTECEFEVRDRRGRPAPWLAKKMSRSDDERIQQEIIEHMEH